MAPITPPPDKENQADHNFREKVEDNKFPIIFKPNYVQIEMDYAREIKTTFQQ